MNWIKSFLGESIAGLNTLAVIVLLASLPTFVGCPDTTKYYDGGDCETEPALTGAENGSVCIGSPACTTKKYSKAGTCTTQQFTSIRCVSDTCFYCECK